MKKKSRKGAHWPAKQRGMAKREIGETSKRRGQEHLKEKYSQSQQQNERKEKGTATPQMS